MLPPQALVIEDRFIAQDLLSQAGFAVTTAATLLRGLVHADLLALNAEAVPTRMLLDLMMPHER